MRYVNWFWVATGLFSLAAILCTVAAFVTEVVAGYLGCSGIALVIAGWACHFIGLKTN